MTKKTWVCKFSENARDDIAFFAQNSPKLLEKVKVLLADMKNDPFHGLGKPEALRFELSGYYSRRINIEHRIVYKVEGNTIFIVAVRYHYKK